MNSRQSCKKTFFVKNMSSDVYKWSPGCPTFNKKIFITGGKTKSNFCTATSGSQGQDWNTTYVYDTTIIDDQQARLAYVECDYVE